MASSSAPSASLWYGLCEYWTDDWSKLANRPGIPLCPFCGAPGFEQDIDEWWKQVDAYEAAGHPGYRKEIEARKGICGKKKLPVQQARHIGAPPCSNVSCRLEYAHSGPCWEFVL